MASKNNNQDVISQAIAKFYKSIGKPTPSEYRAKMVSSGKTYMVHPKTAKEREKREAVVRSQISKAISESHASAVKEQKAIENELQKLETIRQQRFGSTPQTPAGEIQKLQQMRQIMREQQQAARTQQAVAREFQNLTDEQLVGAWWNGKMITAVKRDTAGRIVSIQAVDLKKQVERSAKQKIKKARSLAKPTPEPVFAAVVVSGAKPVEGTLIKAANLWQKPVGGWPARKITAIHAPTLFRIGQKEIKFFPAGQVEYETAEGKKAKDPYAWFMLKETPKALWSFTNMPALALSVPSVIKSYEEEGPITATKKTFFPAFSYEGVAPTPADIYGTAATAFSIYEFGRGIKARIDFRRAMKEIDLMKGVERRMHAEVSIGKVKDSFGFVDEGLVKGTGKVTILQVQDISKSLTDRITKEFLAGKPISENPIRMRVIYDQPYRFFATPTEKGFKGVLMTTSEQTIGTLTAAPHATFSSVVEVLGKVKDKTAIGTWKTTGEAREYTPNLLGKAMWEQHPYVEYTAGGKFITEKSPVVQVKDMRRFMEGGLVVEKATVRFGKRIETATYGVGEITDFFAASKGKRMMGLTVEDLFKGPAEEITKITFPDSSVSAKPSQTKPTFAVDLPHQTQPRPTFTQQPLVLKLQEPELIKDTMASLSMTLAPPLKTTKTALTLPEVPSYSAGRIRFKPTLPTASIKLFSQTKKQTASLDLIQIKKQSSAAWFKLKSFETLKPISISMPKTNLAAKTKPLLAIGTRQALRPLERLETKLALKQAQKIEITASKQTVIPPLAPFPRFKWKLPTFPLGGKGGAAKRRPLKRIKFKLPRLKFKIGTKKSLLASLFSVSKSRARYGKATHPAPTLKIWKLAEKFGFGRVKTVELTKKQKKRRNKKNKGGRKR